MSENNLTLLDRSVVVIVDSPDDTASRRQGTSQSVERLHRMHGTSLIWESSQLLQVGASTFASACIIFHRFFNQYSLIEYDVWSVAMASTLLATKIEEEPHAFKTLINVYSYVYRKRIFATEIGEKQIMSVLEHPSIACLDLAKSSSTEEKLSLLKSTPLPRPLGPVREEWHKQISEMEQIMLRHLGFTLFWIPDSHPHKFILYFCRVLEIDDSKFTQRAWNFCNDSCRLDLCVRFASEVIVSDHTSADASCASFLSSVALTSFQFLGVCGHCTSCSGFWSTPSHNASSLVGGILWL
jgi:hypothetical protein